MFNPHPNDGAHHDGFPGARAADVPITSHSDIATHAAASDKGLAARQQVDASVRAVDGAVRAASQDSSPPADPSSDSLSPSSPPSSEPDARPLWFLTGDPGDRSANLGMPWSYAARHVVRTLHGEGKGTALDRLAVKRDGCCARASLALALATRPYAFRPTSADPRDPAVIDAFGKHVANFALSWTAEEWSRNTPDIARAEFWELRSKCANCSATQKTKPCLCPLRTPRARSKRPALLSVVACSRQYHLLSSSSRPSRCRSECSC